MKIFGVLVACVMLAGCASLTGLPPADGQIRVFEGDVQVQPGGAAELASPVSGSATGHGCIVSQVGKLDAAVTYRGDKCTVRAPAAQ